MGDQLHLVRADLELERPLRDLLRVAVERNVDLAVVRIVELRRDFVEERRVLLGRADEAVHFFLEAVEIDVLEAAAVRRGARESMGELERELADAILRERTDEAVDEAVEDALDRGVVRAITEHRADRGHEVTLDADRLFAPALGDVIEAARDAIGADGVHANARIHELLREPARDRDERAPHRRLMGERVFAGRNLLFRQHDLRVALDGIGDRVAERRPDTSVDQPRTPFGIIQPEAGPTCATRRARSSSPTKMTPGRAREGLAMKSPEATRNAARDAMNEGALSHRGPAEDQGLAAVAPPDLSEPRDSD